MASAKLVRGQTIATWSSCLALVGSPPRAETPPKMNSVMWLTGRPSRFATNECDSSCNRTEEKNKSVVMTETIHASCLLQSSYTSWKNPSDSHHVRSAKMANQLQ